MDYPHDCNAASPRSYELRAVCEASEENVEAVRKFLQLQLPFFFDKFTYLILKIAQIGVDIDCADEEGFTPLQCFNSQDI